MNSRTQDLVFDLRSYGHVILSIKVSNLTHFVKVCSFLIIFIFHFDKAYLEYTMSVNGELSYLFIYSRFSRVYSGKYLTPS